MTFKAVCIKSTGPIGPSHIMIKRFTIYDFIYSECHGFEVKDECHGFEIKDEYCMHNKLKSYAYLSEKEFNKFFIRLPSKKGE